LESDKALEEAKNQRASLRYAICVQKEMN
jgi:hypothetical protein